MLLLGLAVATYLLLHRFFHLYLDFLGLGAMYHDVHEMLLSP